MYAFYAYTDYCSQCSRQPWHHFYLARVCVCVCLFVMELTERYVKVIYSDGLYFSNDPFVVPDVITRFKLAVLNLSALDS